MSRLWRLVEVKCSLGSKMFTSWGEPTINLVYLIQVKLELSPIRLNVKLASCNKSGPHQSSKISIKTPNNTYFPIIYKGVLHFKKITQSNKVYNLHDTKYNIFLFHKCFPLSICYHGVQVNTTLYYRQVQFSCVLACVQQSD